MSEQGKVAIIGASGAIGKPLYTALSQSLKVVGTSRLGSPELIALDLLAPDWDLTFLEGCQTALVLAANSKIADCETHPNQAWFINHRRTLDLVGQIHQRGIHVVFTSTDIVFDGQKGFYRESDDPRPLVVYGQTKWAAEQDILKLTNETATILRLSKIYDENRSGSGLLGEMWDQLKQGKSLRVATDQFFNPLHIQDLIEQFKRLIQAPKPGTWHLCGDERIARYDLALRIANRMGCSDRVQAIHLHDLPGVKRPLDTSMCNQKWQESFPTRFQTLDQALDRLFAGEP